MEFYTWAHMDFACPMIAWTWSGREIALKQSFIVDDANPFSKSVCFITSSSGKATGSIISQRTDPVIVNSKEVRQLILTAGYCLGNCFGNPEPNKELSISFSLASRNGTLYDAKILHDFSDWTKEPLIDTLTHNPYPLPNDIAILALENCDRNDLIDIPIADEVSQDDEVSVVGYPQAPAKILYSAPILRDHNPEEYKEKIFNAFCGFGNRVISSGTVLRELELNYALLVNYTSTSGESGGPIYRIKNNYCELVGVNIGGATLPCHWKLGQIISKIIKNDWDSASDLFQEVQDYFTDFDDYFNEKLQRKLGHVADFIEDKDKDESINCIMELMNLMAAWYKKPNELSHNVAFPCTHPIMKTVKDICQKFRLLPTNETFSSYSELFNSLVR